MQPCSLLSLATAVPPHDHRAGAKRRQRARERSAGRKALFDRLSGVFDNAGIAKRHIVAPIDWYEAAARLGRPQRPLSRSRRSSVRRSGRGGDRTGGPDARRDRRRRHRLDHRHRHAQPRARVGPRLGLRDDIRRVPVFGLGCAGGVNGLATAARLAAAEPGHAAGCSSPSRPARSRSASTATIRPRSSPPPCSATAPPPRSSRSGERRPRDDHRLGARSCGPTRADHGLGRRGPGPRRGLRPRHPAVHRGEAGRSGRRDAARSSGSRASDIDRFCCHPGGVKVIDAIETALELPRASSTSSARCCAIRQHERADGAVRARAADRARPARARADDRVRPRLHLRRPAARSRMIAGRRRRSSASSRCSGWSSCGCRNRNTQAAARRGAVMKSARGHYPLIVALHAPGSRPCGGWRPGRPVDIAAAGPVRRCSSSAASG